MYKLTFTQFQINSNYWQDTYNSRFQYDKVVDP